MEYIEVDGKQFSVLGLGTFPMKGEGFASALSAAKESGYSIVDTAYKYQNEKEIGDFRQSVPNATEWIIQTKFSVTQLAYKKFFWIKYGRKTIDDAIDGSRERLKQACLDVYLLHAPSKGFENYWGDLLRFKEQGKAKTIGVCRFDENQLQIIKNRYGEYPSINQIEVHPYHSNAKLIDFCKEKGIAVEARSVFTHGDALGGLMQEKTLIMIASDCGKTVPQVIIRWVIQKGLITIVKSENPQHIKDNIDVFDFYLTESQMRSIDALNRNLSFGCVSNNRKSC